MNRIYRKACGLLCAGALIAAGIGSAYAEASDSSTYAGVKWNGRSEISIDTARGTTSIERGSSYNDVSYVKIFVDAHYYGQDQSYQNESQNRDNENYTWTAIELPTTLLGNHMIAITSQHRIKLAGYAWSDWIYTGAIY